jgi:hypothetical protein
MATELEGHPPNGSGGTMKTSRHTPLGAVLRGAVAGAVGTAAMDLVWYARYRRGGGTSSFYDWEFSAGLDDWEAAPAPAQVGRRLVEGFTQHELKPDKARAMNNVVHWLYGIAWGAAYGIVAGSAPRAKARHGLLLGPLVWVSGYVTLPLAGLYKPMWEYDAKTLAKDASAHLAFGAATGAVYKALAR